VKRLRAAILGATGIVGQHFVRILHDHPSFQIAALAASERSEGYRYYEAADWVVTGEMPLNVQEMVICGAAPEDLLPRGVDVVFSALPSKEAGHIEQALAGEGVPVFSNAGAHRMDPHVPILIPEINPDHLGLVHSQDRGSGYIVTNSNCSTSGLVFGLKPLVPFGLRDVTVTTYQAVSGAGRRGVASLDILGNVVPYISGEEGKLETEPKKILGHFNGDTIEDAGFEVYASCARVPVLDGHLESVVVTLGQEVDAVSVREAFSSFTGEPQALGLPTAPNPPIVVESQVDRPQPLRGLSLSTGDFGMAVRIGRIRVKGNRVSFFLLVHNTIRGAAGASVLNAEFARVKGYLRAGKGVIP
jgi:aspartate-semialdehyde dehydrogenase